MSVLKKVAKPWSGSVALSYILHKLPFLESSRKSNRRRSSQVRLNFDDLRFKTICDITCKHFEGMLKEVTSAHRLRVNLNNFEWFRLLKVSNKVSVSSHRMLTTIALVDDIPPLSSRQGFRHRSSSMAMEGHYPSIHPPSLEYLDQFSHKYACPTFRVNNTDLAGVEGGWAPGLKLFFS
ncbi:hypothetical protein SCHPADRAFT_265999 [Schizopora paradoxa]|uniref:Uncharacterized protein n=1 Tax=Schizopora paradoxa TaxID=27342 RepID=A0A0H2RTV4_9AGAM|nr:hypothetical protein SCHPADRAFT_265999 [Schizopora paradoxa]